MSGPVLSREAREILQELGVTIYEEADGWLALGDGHGRYAASVWAIEHCTGRVSDGERFDDHMQRFHAYLDHLYRVAVSGEVADGALDLKPIVRIP